MFFRVLLDIFDEGVVRGPVDDGSYMIDFFLDFLRSFPVFLMQVRMVDLGKQSVAGLDIRKGRLLADLAVDFLRLVEHPQEIQLLFEVDIRFQYPRTPFPVRCFFAQLRVMVRFC